MKVTIFAGLIGLLLWTSGVLASPADQMSLLAKLPDALKMTNYRGVFVYARGDVMNSMRVIHRWKDNRMQERLIQLDGQMGEILRDGMNVICILPDNQAISLEQSAPGGHFGSFELDPSKVESLYQVSEQGTEHIAGYLARKLLVQSRDPYRYSYHLWLEMGTMLPLKSLMIDESGKSLESYQFTQIELNPDIQDKELKPEAKGTPLAHSYKSGGRPMSKEISWKLGWLPTGFTRIGDPKKIDLSSGLFMDSVAFTDGLASFTVFVEPKTGVSIPEGGSRMGATMAYTLNRGQHVVTVIGEVPPTTAMKVAESLEVLAH